MLKGIDADEQPEQLCKRFEKHESRARDLVKATFGDDEAKVEAIVRFMCVGYIWGVDDTIRDLAEKFLTASERSEYERQEG